MSFWIVVVLLAVPAGLSVWWKNSNWGVIWVSTILSPFILKVGFDVYFRFFAATSGGVNSGASGYAAGYAPLVFPIMAFLSFVAAGFVVLVRNARREE